MNTQMSGKPERILAGIWSQEKYCREHNLPMFIPGDGRCFRCGHNIFTGEYGFTPDAAGKTLITGCPYCNTSFCD